MSLPQLFLFFITCAFAGWLVEELWVLLRYHKAVNRGFLIGPLCSIYGIGALFILFVAAPFQAHPLLVFLVSAISCAALEYFTSLLMEKLFGARWWDYSNKPFNLQGRICLGYAILFGLLGLALVYLIIPLFNSILTILPAPLTYMSALLLLVLLLADYAVSSVIIKGFKKIKKGAEGDDTDDITAYVRSALNERGRLYRRLNSFNFIIGPPRVLHYYDFDDDLVQNRGQSYRLPAHYQWLRRRSRPLLYFLGRLWAALHRFYAGTKYVNLDILKQPEAAKCFLYANHTQPMGDILSPVDYFGSRRIRLLAAPANLGIPILGHFLPDLGALPVPDSLRGLAKLERAIEHYANAGAPIIIYPEAHVWPYYTKIRPFSSASFTYPVKLGLPVYTAVTIYARRPLLRKPRRVIYFDGPFYPDPQLPRREQVKALHARVFAAMEKSAKHNEVRYVKYIKLRKRREL